MKLKTWGIAALAACLLATTAAPLRAQTGEEFVPPEQSAGMGPSDMAGEMEQSEYDGPYGACNTCPTGGCDSGRGGMLGQLSGGRNVQLIAGAEYIYAQATFSEALAFVERVPGVSDTFHQIDFNHESSYSVFGGLYMPDCGGAVLFEYTELNSSGDFSAAATPSTQIFGPFDVNENIEGFADVDLESYDLSFSKTIPLGCLLSGKECGDCCDDACCDSSCGGGWCPAWDITWSGGARYANVEWQNGITAFDPLNNNAFIDSANTTLDFDGFGGRVGLMGRRYMGRRGLFSLYAKGDWSVLFGEVDIETIQRSAAGGGSEVATRFSNDITVPVTEIELGGSTHLGQHATLSAGYFWSAWHDLGMSPTAVSPFDVNYDDANILGWNGFFARAEIAF